MNIKLKLSRCASCVARCIPPCNLCAYFRNPQGEQQYCQKWHLDKMSKTGLVQNGKKIFQ